MLRAEVRAFFVFCKQNMPVKGSHYFISQWQRTQSYITVSVANKVTQVDNNTASRTCHSPHFAAKTFPW